MKTKIKHKGALLTLITVLFFLGSCEDMLNTDSSRVASVSYTHLTLPTKRIV